MNFIRFDNLSVYSELQHFTTTIDGGVSVGNYTSFNLGTSSGDELQNVIENRKRFCKAIEISPNRLFIPFQTHSNHVVAIDRDFLHLPTEKQQKLLQNTDALLTHEKGIAIGITTADCVPILIYDPKKQVLAAIHAGWRGTVNKIVLKTIFKMIQEFNSKPEDLLAGIGPSICQECFEVGEEVIEAFKEEEFPIEKIMIQNKQTLKYHIDLWKANKILLIQQGISTRNIEISGLCTVTHPNLFFSARRQTIHSGRMITGGILK